MKNFATCEQGHMYDGDVNKACPYCPQSDLKTKVQYQSNVPTIRNDHATGVVHASVGATKIFGPEDLQGQKKLMGFLVSYDLNPLGKTFYLYEGKNLIGTSNDSDVQILTDERVSAKNTTILFRAGQCKCKDEFSTNGTYVNEKIFDEGTLQDKDLIRVGDTRFCLLLIPQNN